MRSRRVRVGGWRMGWLGAAAGLGVLWCVFSGCASGNRPAPWPVVADPFSPLGGSRFDAATPAKVGASRVSPAAVGRRGMVVADDAVAAGWGAEILARGGTAVDAAVATVFAMSVTRPHYAALGGGGFMLYCPKPEKVLGALPGSRPAACHVVDFRERAPRAATRNMYVRDGKARTDLSQDGALASGVPGLVAGFLRAHEKWGKLPRQALLKRPIELARNGVIVSGMTEHAASERWKAFNAEAKRIWGCAASNDSAAPASPCAAGTRVRQPDLAKVLSEISDRGADGFYRGWVAKKLVEGLQVAGGVMTVQDLDEYRPVDREPLRGEFRGMEVVTMPPPSAGGALVLQMLEYVDLAGASGEFSEGFGSARSTHALAHAMRLAFADRAEVFGDPGFARVPVDELLSFEYVKNRWQSTYALPSAPTTVVKPGIVFSPSAATDVPAGPAAREGNHTTHFSVIDREGNAVAVTVTVNDNFGSGFVPPGTGVVMNNEMDDFSIEPGVPNLFGLVGAEANAIAPGKRPLSSMTPTIVRDADGNARLVLGAAGGPRITTAVFQAVVNRLYFGMTLPDAVMAPRVHHQWKPDELRIESLEGAGYARETRERLKALGYTVKEVASSGRMHALERFVDGRVWGVPDRRAEGAAVSEEIATDGMR